MDRDRNARAGNEIGQRQRVLDMRVNAAIGDEAGQMAGAAAGPQPPGGTPAPR